MSERDYASTPVADALGLKTLIRDLSADLSDLRAGAITVNDALARAALAKQIWNGVRLYMAVGKSIEKDLPTAQIEGKK
jgi:hypothetical protein